MGGKTGISGVWQVRGRPGVRAGVGQEAGVGACMGADVGGGQQRVMDYKKNGNGCRTRRGNG